MPMRRMTLWILLPVLLLGEFGSGPAAAGDEHVLAGTYTSGYQDGPERVRAVFTPRGEADDDTWDVIFHFTFGNRQREYRGVAEGSLTEGELSGRVENEDGTRTFSFRGEHKKGKYRATHAEVFRDGERKTGTMTLKG